MHVNIEEAKEWRKFSLKNKQNAILDFTFMFRKSSAQRSKEWKAKNPEKAKQQARKKNANYYGSLTASLTEQEKQSRREKLADQRRARRMKKKLESLQIPDEEAFDLPFGSPQVKGKALKKVRTALPVENSQKVAVLKTLINEVSDSNIGELEQKSSRFLPESTVKKVTDFYLSDDISRCSPNVKDFVSVQVQNQRQKLSVKHLYYPIKEIHGMFQEKYPEEKIGIDKFFKLRPPNVLSTTKMPHNICCCRIHENIRGALKGLKKSDDVFHNINDNSNMHENFVCLESTTECFTNDCIACKDGCRLTSMLNLVESSSLTTSWTKWIPTQKSNSKEKTSEENHKNQYCNVEKVKKSGTIAQLIEELKDLVPEFLDHQFVKMNQSKFYKQTIEKCEDPKSSCALVVCDFAEKFKCVQQNATQSAHYGQQPVSIFTVGIYHRGFTPMTVVSDNEKQTKETVLSYLDLVLENLPVTVKTVEIWSDNASSQFKNQYIMESLKRFQLQYDLKIRWNFFAAMHGKSVVDGIGGSVKRFVRERIISRDLIVDSAAKFAEIASEMNVRVFYINQKSIDTRNASIGLQNIIKSAKLVPETKKKHSFEVQTVKKGKQFVSSVVGFKISRND